MATVKLATLVIRTLAKPISSQLKNQAKQHDTFRSICISLAQRMHMAEVKLRTNILGEPARLHVKPLSETRAIENGANALAEGFLFSVAALLIIGETWRSSRSQSKQRGDVNERIEELSANVTSLTERLERIQESLGDVESERARNNELARIVERVVEIGLRGGWAEFEDTPLKIPRVELAPTSSRVLP
ncbi:optic atrophy 3 protein-domain-containing protein [Suillus lakei]|nr:optic atrophy 3 protein-domain-containing protein [Suillus lakei]